MSTPGRPTESSDELFLDWLANVESGRGPSFEDFCSAHPERAERLKKLFAVFEHGRSVLSRLQPLATPGADDGEELPYSPPTANAEDAAERYSLQGEIARGGMGAVLEIYDKSLRRTIAMKVLRTDLPGGRPGAPEFERRQSRLLAEAQILGQLDHPGVVAIHEVGIDEKGRAFFTMKRVKGSDFGTVVELFHRGAKERGDAEWTLPRAVGVLVKVCEAVAYAHQKGVVHRDLKPSNVMVGRFGEVFVMDWGLAKVLGRSELAPVAIQRIAILDGAREDGAGAQPGSSSSCEPSLSLVHTDRESDSGSSTPVATLHGDIVGTPAYMPPEQAEGDLERVDGRADVYAIGAMLYQLLSGVPPYFREEPRTSHEVLRDVLAGPPRALEQLARSAPGELVSVCQRAMARAAESRYSTVLELAEDLRAWLEGRVVSAHERGAWIELTKWIRRNRWATATIGVGILALVAVIVVQSILQGRVIEARDDAQARAEELRRESYVGKIALAVSAVDRNDTLHAKENLQACPEDLRDWEWRYLARELDTSDAHVRGGEVGFRFVAWSPDGRWIAAAGQDTRDHVPGTGVHLFDARTLERRWSQTQNRMPDSVAFTPNGRALLVPVRYSQVLILDVETGAILDTLRTSNHAFMAITSPDGREVLLSKDRGDVDVWDFESRTLLRTLRGASGAVESLATSLDGRRIYVPDWSGRVRVWNVADGSVEHVLTVSHDRVTAVSTSPDGRFLAAGGWEQALLVYDLATRERVFRSDANRDGIGGTGLSWSRDSRWLAAVDANTIDVYEVPGFRARARLIGHEDTATSCCFDPTSTRLASVGADGLRIWDIGDARRLTQSIHYPEAVEALAFSPDSRKLARVESSGQLVIRDLSTGADVRRRAWERGQSTLEWSPADDVLAYAKSRGKASLVDATTLEPTCTLRERGTNGTSFSPDGSSIALFCDDGQLELWDVASGARRWSTRAYPFELAWPWGALPGGFSPDGRLVASGGRQGSVRLWNTGDGTLAREIWMPGEIVDRGYFSVDGRYLVAGMREPMMISRFDLSAGAVAWSESTWSWSLVLPLANSRRVFTVGRDSSLAVWDESSGRRLLSLPAVERQITSHAVSPDGASVAIGGAGGLRIYDSRPWRE